MCSQKSSTLEASESSTCPHQRLSPGCPSGRQPNPRRSRVTSTCTGREDARSRAGRRAPYWWSTHAQAQKWFRARVPDFVLDTARDRDYGPQLSEFRNARPDLHRQLKKLSSPREHRPRPARDPRYPRESCICVMRLNVIIELTRQLISMNTK